MPGQMHGYDKLKTTSSYQLARDNGYLAQACFYASQAAEKGLKSVLLELGFEPPHTHVLNDLVKRLKKNRP